MSNKVATVAKKKLNIKEKVDEDRLDLSLCSLENVPIKEITGLFPSPQTKATPQSLRRRPSINIKIFLSIVLDENAVSKRADYYYGLLRNDCGVALVCGDGNKPVLYKEIRKLNLSFNALTYLTDDFIKLQHIKELDLSKNRLRGLPKNFGQLTGLKSLDLLGNELTGLPSSFCELKNLQWLDLKDNPLPPQLKQAAGDCLDEAQCKKCAVNVIRFIKTQAADEERQRQIELKKKRDDQLKKEALEREKAEELKLQKKQEREQRRLINEKKRLEREHQRSETNDDDDDSEASRNDAKFKNSDKKSSKQSSCLKMLLTSIFYLTLFLLLSFGVLILFTKYCEADKSVLKSKYEILRNTFIESSLKLLDEKVCPVLEKNSLTITKMLNFL